MTASKSSTARVEELIEQAKVVRPVPQAARARVLKRAEASMLAAGAFHISHKSLPLKSHWSRAWFGGAATATLLAAAAALALHGRQPVSGLERAPADNAAIAGRPPLAPAVTASAPVPEHELSPPPPPPVPQPPAVSRRVGAAESYAPELELLRRAHAAYGSKDFANALRLLAEHGRQFPNGRLAEEREALRVRTLSSLGQSDSARRAARAFAARFPRSVLLSRTMAAVDAGE